MTPGSLLLRVGINDEGIIDLSELEAILRAYNMEGAYGDKRVSLVAVTGASNVLGIYNDLARISRIAHDYNALFLVDAAQMAAHRRIDMDAWGIDFLAFSGHKVYAPFGCGVLVVRRGLSGFSSEELEGIRSSGEANLCGIAALGMALRLLMRVGMDQVRQEEQVLTERLLRGLSQIPGLKAYGVTNPDLPVFSYKGGVVAFEIKGRFADKIARELAESAGIGVRFGCHCAHMLIKHLFRFTPLLERIQNTIVTVYPGIQLPGMTRVSIGIGNSEQDIDTLVRVLGEIARKEPMKITKVKNQIEEFVQEAENRVYRDS